ncbi:hypothetical protein E5554_16030 [Sphingobium sp. PAMC28499]|uniref:hypothetical protein n=1 Tax=Sphingobium sp. PAMC28499 TaxID=2565554 RepID=UPI00109E02EF|nr:hypothetical protein [Sphingobium sp. PAMC28499]QCB39202.1 hypothetical protein E5554_16030 [Sphingobium sp. PAMC28499]|tara:strand:+ start:1336 stop:1683 length:348 start_codon:yes stop_codon:yes gene_type:complete
MSAAKLANHIRELIAADATLSSLNLGLVNFGIPAKLPAIYIDGIVFDDTIRTHITFNLCYVTTDLSIEQFDVAQRILEAVQESNALTASSLLPRPEPENKRNRWMIPCKAYPSRL